MPFALTQYYLNKKRMNYTKRHIFTFLLSNVIILTITGCGIYADRGLLTQTYPREEYNVPKLLPEDTENFNPTFIVYGDTQGSWSLSHRFLKRDTWLNKKAFIFPFYQIYEVGKGSFGFYQWSRRVPDVDPELRVFIRDAVYSGVGEYNADFILNTGDICTNDGRRPQNWKVFLRENMRDSALLREVPYLPTAGNHDRVTDKKWGYPNYEAVFGYEPFYRIDFKDATLIVIDSNLIIDWKNEMDDELQQELFKKWFVSDDPENPAWFQRQLADSDKPFKIVSIHHSPFSFAHHWNDWLNEEGDVEKEIMRGEIVKVMQKYSVNAVFSGHDHIYQHNLLKLDGYPGGGIHFIVSSSGGVPLREETSLENIQQIRVNYLINGFDVEPIKHASIYHYAVVKVDSASLDIKSIELSPDGSESVYDTLTIGRD